MPRAADPARATNSARATEHGVPTTLRQPGAVAFWLAVLLTGVGAGVGATLLVLLLGAVQHLVWPGSSNMLDAAAHASAARHVLALVGAGVLVGVGQIVLHRLTSGNGTDISAAIWFSAGRLPTVRTLGTSVLAVTIVAMGASLGREGAPKQVGAVVADLASDRARLSDDQRRLLVACGAGAGMAAVYGVPLGGALFALEVLRGALSLRLVLPALLASVVATAVCWLFLPETLTYTVAMPDVASSVPAMAWALLVGPIAGVVSVGYVRLITRADRSKPTGWRRLVAPTFALGLLGLVSIWFPQLLGNGKDVAQLTFDGRVAPALLVALVVLKPAATALCLGSGAPGGLFTPSLAMGALLGAFLGSVWSSALPGLPPGACAMVGAGAVLAATTQGPISSTVILVEMTGRGHAFIAPLILAVATATLVSRTIDPRSIYDAQLNDQQLAAQLKSRESTAQFPAATPAR